MKLIKLVSKLLILVFLACDNRPEIVFDNSAKTTFSIEIADTDEKREKGLMYRKELDLDSGMLFVFPEEKIQSFWMRNTFIPLDLVFISKDLKVVGIIKNARILNDEPLKVEKESMYVFEINSGLSEKYGISVGQKVKLPS